MDESNIFQRRQERKNQGKSHEEGQWSVDRLSYALELQEINCGRREFPCPGVC